MTASVLPKFYIDVPSPPERVVALAKFEAAVEVPTYRVGQFGRSLRQVRKINGVAF
jgi:hypothetical protein